MSATGSIFGDDTPAQQADGVHGIVLLLLFDDRMPWTVDELGRELNSRVEAADAVASLAGAGLVHRLGDFVIPTRAARRSDEIFETAI
jgi:hypothetical protein